MRKKPERISLRPVLNPPTSFCHLPAPRFYVAMWFTGSLHSLRWLPTPCTRTRMPYNREILI